MVETEAQNGMGHAMFEVSEIKWEAKGRQNC